MRRLRFSLPAALVSFVSFASVASFAGSAHANPMPGEGYAGKPNPAFPNGDRCGRCHTGGAAPTAELTGPTTLQAGATGTYSLRVASTNRRESPYIGAAIAASDGVVLTAGANVAKQVEELTHSGGPKTDRGDGVEFKFEAKAPASGSSFLVYFVGMAANGNGDDVKRGMTGDNSTPIMTQRITVTGGATSGGADAGSSGGTDAGSSGTSGGPRDAGGTSGGASGASGGANGTTSGGTTSGGASSGGEDDGEGEGADDGGCSSAGGSTRGAGLAALVGLGLVALSRRLRRRG